MTYAAWVCLAGLLLGVIGFSLAGRRLFGKATGPIAIACGLGVIGSGVLYVATVDARLGAALVFAGVGGGILLLQLTTRRVPTGTAN